MSRTLLGTKCISFAKPSRRKPTVRFDNRLGHGSLRKIRFDVSENGAVSVAGHVMLDADLLMQPRGSASRQALGPYSKDSFLDGSSGAPC